MNKLKYIFIATALGLSFTACDDDHQPDWTETAPFDVNAVEQSLADGSTMVSVSTNTIEVLYDTKIVINPAVSVTLNGEPLETEIKDDNRLVAKVELRKGKNYVFVIPGRAVTGVGSKTFAKEIVINFSTEKSVLDKTNLATALVNPNASASAKAVYNMLVQNYGTKQLSGAMGAVAWETSFSDLVAEKAGKYPAIVGFDYIHLGNSPSNWIDYGDITPVKNVWNAGSIPAVAWHWNVDHEVFATETVMPSDWSNNIQLTAGALGSLPTVFQELQEGSVITVKIKDVAAGAQGSVKNSSWSELAPGLEYFDISGDEFTVKISTGEMLEQIKTEGFIISGHDYTVTSVLVGKTCKESKGEGFIASNVLIPGTRENAVATADVAKLAGYLQLLRDADIPVLFRPFHEAVGDYTWGHWFWWGNSGVETTKELWKWLYNTLTNDYGLNNLIWVWTMQTSDEGKLADVSKLKAAYPGDEYVDIVGADLYEAALSDQSDRFHLLYEAVGGKKIVALSECGNLLDPEIAEEEGALWSFFMGWYEQDGNGPGFFEWNLNGEWSTVLNNPLVLNRGDFSVK